MFNFNNLVKTYIGDIMKRNKKIKKSNRLFILFFLSLFLLYFGLYYIYVTFIDVPISPNYDLERLQSTDYLQTVEEASEKSMVIADIIEQVSSSVVGISKLKNNSSSIFSNNVRHATWSW